MHLPAVGRNTRQTGGCTLHHRARFEQVVRQRAVQQGIGAQDAPHDIGRKAGDIVAVAVPPLHDAQRRQCADALPQGDAGNAQ